MVFVSFYQLIVFQLVAALAKLFLAALAHFQDLHDECFNGKRQSSQEGSFL
jgi:hypothetical protein